MARRACSCRLPLEHSAHAPAGAPAAGAAPAPPAGPPLAAEFALTKEPLYEGEPILALAADTEEIAAEALERIIVDFEPLPFVVDPLDALRPDGPNGRTEGNVFAAPNMKTLKWTAADIALVDAGKFPSNAEAVDVLSIGDIEAGFKEADLIVERDSQQQTTSHQPLESRSAMAYWQNGKLYLHGSTQSLARTVGSVAGWVGIKPEDVVLISEYCGGGFGSKIPGAQTMAIPALMSKKLNGRPVMMRISREEETYIGRVRPGYQSWVKMGFKKDGRVTAIDAFIVEASGPVSPPGRQLDLGQSRVADVSDAEHALPRHLGVHQHAAGCVAARARRACSSRSCSSRSCRRPPRSWASIRSRSGRSTPRRARRRSGCCRQDLRGGLARR